MAPLVDCKLDPVCNTALPDEKKEDPDPAKISPDICPSDEEMVIIPEDPVDEDKPDKISTEPPSESKESPALKSKEEP